MQRGIRHLLIISIIKGHGWKRADMQTSLYHFTMRQYVCVHLFSSYFCTISFIWSPMARTQHFFFKILNQLTLDYTHELLQAES